jgi:hypothetical protein
MSLTILAWLTPHQHAAHEHRVANNTRGSTNHTTLSPRKKYAGANTALANAASDE